MQKLENNKILKDFKRGLRDLFRFSFFKERRLSFEFAFLTSGVIVLIVLCMGWYINAAMNSINDKAQLQNNTVNVSIAATIFNLLGPDIDSGNFTGVSNKIQGVLTNRVLAYLIIENNKTHKIEFSSLPKDVFKINEKNELCLRKIYSNTQYKRGIKKNYILYAGFYTNPTFQAYLDMLLKQLFSLVIAFVLMGLWLSYFLSRKIISPLNSLIKATGEFEQGDLSNRVERTSYTEINELVVSYNSMADALQRLYSSLGQQVQERTKQLEEAYSELQNTQAMMVHSEKMKSLGELVAGIMHEINNPINFIYGNLSHLNNYSSDLIKVIDTYLEYSSDLNPEHQKAIKDLMQEIDYDFLKSDLPDLIRSCREGTERTKNIILDLKDFSRLEEVALTSVDLPKEIDTTLNILHNKFKNRIKVHQEYQDNLPKVEAYGGQLNQVFMNILDNAAYAITDFGQVWIRIKVVDKNVIIEFEDDGKGMDDVTLQKIFNPFFTTKPVGQGTGLGMAISYKVIKNHQGSIHVDTKVGKGTKFTITLPINRVKESENKRKEPEPEFEIIE